MEAPKTLKGKKFRENEQFPVETENRRKQVVPVAKLVRQDQDKVLLVSEQRFLNGQKLIYNKYNRRDGY